MTSECHASLDIIGEIPDAMFYHDTESGLHINCKFKMVWYWYRCGEIWYIRPVLFPTSRFHQKGMIESSPNKRSIFLHIRNWFFSRGGWHGEGGLIWRWWGGAQSFKGCLNRCLQTWKGSCRGLSKTLGTAGAARLKVTAFVLPPPSNDALKPYMVKLVKPWTDIQGAATQIEDMIVW